MTELIFIILSSPFYLMASRMELKVEAKTAQIIYTDAQRKVAFTQFQMLAARIALCFNMPASTDMVATLTKSAIKGEFHPSRASMPSKWRKIKCHSLKIFFRVKRMLRKNF